MVEGPGGGTVEYRGEGSIGQPVDRKYRFLAVSVEHGSEHDEHDAIVFCTHDPALPYALHAYREESIRLGAPALQIRAVDTMIEGVRLWQARYPAKVRVASVEDPALLRDPEPAQPAARTAEPESLGRLG